MPRRYYSSTAQRTQLVAPLSNSATTMIVAGTPGFPGTRPYTLIIDQDTINEEVVTVTAASGTTLTITRGEDGTSPVAHDLGATVWHGFTGRDLGEPQAHMDSSSGVHGRTGEVVGDTDTQTLSNKTMSGADNTFTDIPQSAVTDLVGDLAEKAPIDSPTFTGNPVLPASTTLGDLSPTEISYLNGVTSNVQAQLDAKAPVNNPTFTGTVSLPGSTSIGGATSGDLANIAGTTSNIQAQINALAGGSFSVLPVGGSTGQVLTKLSDADFHVDWQTLTIIGNGAAADAIWPEDAFSGGTKTTYTDPVSGFVYEVRTIDYTTGSTTSITNSVGVIGKLLIVAGGGGGGSGKLSWTGAGGGAGAAWYGDYAFGAGQHNLLVGAGGNGGGGLGQNGQDSSFDNIVCFGGGGGGGGGSNGTRVDGASGGCGGGGSGGNSGFALGGTGLGGSGATLNTFFYSNGSNGGQNGVSGGSTGLTCDITGTNVTYGVGGGGGTATQGTDGLGSGGGGGGNLGGGGARGGHGVIIIRYRIA